MGIKEKLLSWFLPSQLIELLKGNKRIIGGVSLLLYVLIYVIPVLRPEWTWAAMAGFQIQDWLTGLGVNFNDTLLDAGTGLTVIGLLDWVTGYFLSDAATKGLQKAEKVLKFKVEPPPE